MKHEKIRGPGLPDPPDPYMDNELKPTADKIGNIMNNGKINGSVYMIPRYFGTVLDWKFIYNNDMVSGKHDMSKICGFRRIRTV